MDPTDSWGYIRKGENQQNPAKQAKLGANANQEGRKFLERWGKKMKERRRKEKEEKVDMGLFPPCLYPLCRGPPVRDNLCEFYGKYGAKKNDPEKKKDEKLGLLTQEYQKMMDKQARNPPWLLAPQYADFLRGNQTYNSARHEAEKQSTTTPKERKNAKNATGN